MENLKNVGIAIVVSAVVVALGFTLLNKPTEQAIPPKQLGAVPGNSIEGKYFTVGGVERAYVYMPAIATSSVPCVTKNPFSATSTLLSFTARFTDTVTDTTRGMDLATSSNAYLSATSSSPIVVNWQEPSNAAMDFLWAGQTTTGYAHYSLKPTQYIGLKVATATPGDDTFTGYCTAVFQKL